MNDFWSIPVTNATAEVIDALDHFSTRLVRFDAGVEAILEAASLFPSVPLVRAYAAALLLYAQTDPARREATQHLDAIRFNGVHLSAREAALVSALEAWAKNEHLRALDIFEALLLDYPQDLPAAKMAEYLYYIIGQQFAGPRYLAQMNRLADFHGDQPDFLSMWAFAHELCGEYDRAQALAEQAIDGERRNPWAHHCLSHVTHRQGKIEEGRRMMERFAPIWQECGRPVHCHNAWHLALMYLEERRFDLAKDIFDSVIWGQAPDMVGEQIDAIALLWRMELAGYRAEDVLWESIAKHVEPRSTETFMPFLNAQFAYALARAGRTTECAAMVASVQQRAAGNDPDALHAWRPVGAALVEAAVAQGQGDGATAAAKMDPVMDRIAVVGGSDAQVDLFRQSYLGALSTAGRKADARRWLSSIRHPVSMTPLDEWWDKAVNHRLVISSRRLRA